MMRLGVCALVVVLLLGACSGSDVLDVGSDPTVPVVTAPQSSTTTPTVAAEEDPEASTTSTPPPPEDGDINAATVKIDVVGVFDEPVAIASRTGDDAIWLAERGGLVSRIDSATGEVLETVIDISDRTTASGEQGLLGLAIDDLWVYLNYTDNDGTTNVDAFALEPVGSQPPVNASQRYSLLTQAQPFGNHNGGGLAIGPDGYLYIGFGDGGSGGDPDKNGQNSSTWLGSILRIDPTPDEANPYIVPPDNPFTAGGGLPEIFITGVRNPWRFSFDSATGNLWIADVGQNEYEEIDLLLAANQGGAGANLGWSIREGFHEFDGPDSVDLTDPVWEYNHAAGCSVSGGVVYRGAAIGDLSGVYLFGDYCTSVLWGISTADDQVTFRSFGVDIPGGDLVGLATGPGHEVYTLSLNGELGRVVQS